LRSSIDLNAPIARTIVRRSLLWRITAGFALMIGGYFAWPLPSQATAQPLDPKQHVSLPDTEISRSGAFKAWLIDPTTRYDHGVLGDAVEAGGFIVENAGRRLVFTLPHEAVFEDRRVRLADLDGDGVPEAILVKSYLQRGAAIAVYRILRDRIEPLAESDAIGMRNRWLNPIGIADFAGTGRPMIAAVVTPHLSGSLRLYSLEGSNIAEVARIDGYTNHILGSRDLDLGRIVRVTGNGQPMIILPTLNRNALAAISFHGATPHVVKLWPQHAQIESVRINGGLRARLLTTSGLETVDLNEK
jgi:hypothetical protein